NFTIIDFKNALKYAEMKFKPHRFKFFLQQYPQIFSHLEYKYEPLDQNDFYIPKTLSLQQLNLIIGEKICKKLTCFNYKMGGSECHRNDKVEAYRSGNSVLVGCHSSCYS